MKAKAWLIIAALAAFIVLIAPALWRELAREEAAVGRSVTGTVEIDPALWRSGLADVVKTDRLALYLVDPKTREPVALTFESPLVPPQTIRIGEQHARSPAGLNGELLLIGITDKDGEVFRVSPGEIYGQLPNPVTLGTERVKLVLDQPFRGSLFNTVETAGAPSRGAPPQMGGGAPPMMGGGGPMMSAGPLDGQPVDNAYAIRGEIRVAPALAENVSPSDRLVLLLFDPAQGRPVTSKIIPHTLLPQAFTLALSKDMPGVEPGKGYDIRVVTDKDNNPFGSAAGELVGRSKEPVPLGTKGYVLELDQPYVR